MDDPLGWCHPGFWSVSAVRWLVTDLKSGTVRIWNALKVSLERKSQWREAPIFFGYFRRKEQTKCWFFRCESPEKIFKYVGAKPPPKRFRFEVLSKNSIHEQKIHQIWLSHHIILSFLWSNLSHNIIFHVTFSHLIRLFQTLRQQSSELCTKFTKVCSRTLQLQSSLQSSNFAAAKFRFRYIVFRS